ncbi:hypothetical protein LguiB_006330 [Lonicera macranthoides]
MPVVPWINPLLCSTSAHEPSYHGQLLKESPNIITILQNGHGRAVFIWGVLDLGAVIWDFLDLTSPPPSLTIITAITQHHDHRRRSPPPSPPLFTTEASSTSKSLALTSEIHFQITESRDLLKLITIIVFDIKTAGFNRENERINEIALQDLLGGKKSNSNTWDENGVVPRMHKILAAYKEKESEYKMTVKLNEKHKSSLPGTQQSPVWNNNCMFSPEQAYKNIIFAM